MPGGGRTAYAGSTWSGGWINALGADHAWTYDDGPGGSNLACRTGGSTYCRGHRDVPLANSGPVPSDAGFTWAKAKKLLGIR